MSDARGAVLAVAGQLAEPPLWRPLRIVLVVELDLPHARPEINSALKRAKPHLRWLEMSTSGYVHRFRELWRQVFDDVLVGTAVPVERRAKLVVVHAMDSSEMIRELAPEIFISVQLSEAIIQVFSFVMELL